MRLRHVPKSNSARYRVAVSRRNRLDALAHERGGNDPAIIPDEPIAFWRLPEVIKRTGCSRSTIQRLVAAGQFPKPVTLRAIELEPIGG